MIKRKPPAKSADTRFSVVDIENSRDGKVLAIGHSWRENGVIKHRVFAAWEDWFPWVVSQAKQSQIFRTIYAHNGGGWDWLSFLQWYMKAKPETVEVGLVQAQSNLVFLDVSFTRLKDEKNRNGNQDRESRLSIKLCDSMYILRSRLNDLAKKLLDGRGKLEANIEDVWNAWENDKPRFYAYLESDCELLLLVLEKSLDLIREQIAPIRRLGLTIGSLAMDVFKTIWCDRKWPIHTDLPPEVETLCREGYHGGRVEVFKHGYYQRVNVYDINSLYPFAMVRSRVPCSARTVRSNSLWNDCVGVYRISYNQVNRTIPPVIVDATGNGAYMGEGVYYSPEIHYLKEVDPLATIEIKDGFVFLDNEYLFGKFVNKLYAIRLDGDPAVSLLCKYILNSLYGKFGQRGDRERLILFDSLDAAIAAETTMLECNEADEREWRDSGNVGEFKPKKRLDPLERNSLIYIEAETRKVDHAHCAIAGTITSQARVELHRGIMEAGGQDTVIYCDTDSVHTTGNLLHRRLSARLGDFKLEFEGEGVYAGKKLYANRKPIVGVMRVEYQTKVRAKGISVSRRQGDFGADLGFDDLVKLVDGGSKTCYFGRPATFRGVLSGVQSCSLGLVKRQRKVRRT